MQALPAFYDPSTVYTCLAAACRYSEGEITTHGLGDASFRLFVMSLALLRIQEHCASCTIIMSGVHLQSTASGTQPGITNVFTSCQNCSTSLLKKKKSIGESTRFNPHRRRCGLKNKNKLASCFKCMLV